MKNLRTIQTNIILFSTVQFEKNVYYTTFKVYMIYILNKFHRIFKTTHINIYEIRTNDPHRARHAHMSR